MTREPDISHSSYEAVRTVVITIALLFAALWIAFQFLQPLPPRRIVLASGVEYGNYHR
jgi:hypothetical protein